MLGDCFRCNSSRRIPQLIHSLSFTLVRTVDLTLSASPISSLAARGIISRPVPLRPPCNCAHIIQTLSAKTRLCCWAVSADTKQLLSFHRILHTAANSLHHISRHNTRLHRPTRRGSRAPEPATASSPSPRRREPTSPASDRGITIQLPQLARPAQHAIRHHRRTRQQQPKSAHDGVHPQLGLELGLLRHRHRRVVAGAGL